MKDITRILFFFSLAWIACAKQGFPPGGPVDKFPPEVVETFPAQGALGVGRNVTVQIRFDERIQARDAADAVFISPYPGDDVKMKISGRNVQIRFPGPLLSDRTYVITLGTAIQDLRGNALKKSFTLAFSTGPVLDTGEIDGRVYTDGKALGLDVWAYLIGDSSKVRPGRNSPGYIVQCDDAGRFRFTHLAPGRYRLFAVRDRISDRLYQPMEDEIGMTFRDAWLRPENGFREDGFVFRTMVEDTIPPRLVRAGAVDPRRIVLQFSEPVRFDSVRTDWIRLISVSDSLTPVRVETAYPDPESERRVFAITAPLADGEAYRVSVDRVRDLSDNRMEREFSRTEFTARIDPDTTAPRLVRVFPEPESRDIPTESTIRLLFDEPMDTVSTEGVVLADSAGHPVAGTPAWISPPEWVFRPKRPLMSFASYMVRIKPDSVFDCAGNALPDTGWGFRTLNVDTLGALAGTVSDPDSLARGAVYVSVFPTSVPEAKRTLRLDGPGPFEIARLFPGRYRLEAFRDEDGDGRYSHGSPWPYVPAERFVVHPDTLAVRSGWVREGFDLALPDR